MTSNALAKATTKQTSLRYEKFEQLKRTNSGHQFRISITTSLLLALVLGREKKKERNQTQKEAIAKGNREIDWVPFFATIYLVLAFRSLFLLVFGSGVLPLRRCCDFT